MKTKIVSGIMVTMFLVTMFAFAIPVKAREYTGDPIFIGAIGPKGWIQWDGTKEGFLLAQKLINDAGGMKDAEGKTHELKLVEIDEHGVPIPDPTAGITEMLTALDTHEDMQFLIGGFQEGCVLPMREAAMDYAAVHGRPIWDICGTSTDKFIDDGPVRDNPYDDVRENYDRYKYMFRSDPMNATWLGNILFYMLAQYQVPKLSALFGSPLPTYLCAEDLVWADEIVAALEALGPTLGIRIVKTGRPSYIETDFGPYLDEIEDSGAKLVIHLFSAVAGATFIKQWGERKIPAVPCGINVESQSQEFYSSIGGKCEYEVFMSATGTRTNINPNAKPLSTVEFWDAYVDMFGHAPIYTAWGSYLFPLVLNWTAADWYGSSCDEIIPTMEDIELQNTFLGVFKYTNFHDLYCDEYSLTPIWPSYGAPPHVQGKIGTIRAHIPQWQAGRQEIVWPRGYWCAPNPNNPPMPDPTPLPFARKWKIPPWVYRLGETDFAGPYSFPSPPMQVDTTPAGFFGYLPLPDGTVGQLDIDGVTGLWQKTCWWTMLEADMDNNNFIDIDDVARVALDWGKTA